LLILDAGSWMLVTGFSFFILNFSFLIQNS